MGVTAVGVVGLFFLLLGILIREQGILPGQPG